MFEQESFDKATAPAVPQQVELFRNYEIKPWGFAPAIYKIVALSAIVNLAFLAVVSQTSVLTARGCDSPWVGRVCQVVDMAYLSAMLYGTDREFVDEAYENIDLGEADITFVDVTRDSPPLSYPEGYFQIANPIQFAMLQQQAANGGTGTTDFTASLPSSLPTSGYIPPAADDSILNMKPTLPPAGGGLIEDVTPNNGSSAGTYTPRKGRGPRIGKPANTNTAPTPDEDLTANANTNPQPTPVVTNTDPLTGVEINKRPMVDLGNWVNEKVEKKEVDLQTQFMVNAKGKLDKDGRLDPKTFAFLAAQSPDEDMVEVVKRSIEALNVAGYLQYLKELSGKDFNLLLQQDTENISAVVQSEMETDRRANSIKSGLELLISIAKSRKTAANADQNDKDDLIMLENAKVETDGKKVVIRFTVPKTIAHPMIQRKLAEQAASNLKPSGLAPTQAENNTAKK